MSNKYLMLQRAKKPTIQNEYIISRSRLICCFVLLLFGFFNVCRLIIVLNYTTLYIGSAYVIYPLPWKKKETWRKRKVRQIVLLLKQVWKWKKSFFKLMQTLPTLSFTFISLDNNDQNSNEEQKLLQTRKTD